MLLENGIKINMKDKFNILCVKELFKIVIFSMPTNYIYFAKDARKF